MKKLLFLVSEDSYFCSHRLSLAQAARRAGFTVAVATKCSTHYDQIKNAGIQVFSLKHFTRAGINPIKQCLLLLELYKIYQNFKPDIIHPVAIKPVILGSLMARFCKVPKVINALGGLGYLFTGKKSTGLTRITWKKTILRFMVSKLFLFIFRSPNTLLLLQNTDDRDTLVQQGCVSADKIKIIRGAGVDIHAFPAMPFPPLSPIIIRCISRMLWDKGIGELIKAAKILKEKNSAIQIELYGLPDPENPTSIQMEELLAWQASNIITWHGQCQDVANAYAGCHIAVLPSYREGLPKSLLEAASCARPIVTTNVPGCREVVIEGENGFLVPAKDSIALANALLRLSEDPKLQLEMGQKGRARVETYFSDAIIHAQTLALYST